MIVVNGQNFLTVNESSQILGYTPDYVRRLIKRNRLVSQHLGGLYCISESDLRSFIAERAKKAQKKDKKK